VNTFDGMTNLEEKETKMMLKYLSVNYGGW